MTAICLKYNISREKIKKYLDDKLVDVTNLPIPLKGIGKNAQNWNVAIIGITESLAHHFQGKLTNLLTVTAFNLHNFSKKIATVIVQQIKKEYDNQGFFSYLTQGKFITTYSKILDIFIKCLNTSSHRVLILLVFSVLAFFKKLLLLMYKSKSQARGHFPGKLLIFTKLVVKSYI